MKIIIINNLYSPWARGGAERIAEKTVEGLAKAGHEVFVIATAPSESRTDKIYYLPSIFYNLEKYPLAVRFFWHLWDLVNFVNAKKIKKFLADKKPDLVITHNLQGIGYLLPRLLRKMKIKHIHTLHDIQLLHPSGLMIWAKEKMIDTLPAKIYQAITRALIVLPAAVISPSAWLLREHEKKGFFEKSAKIVLPNYFNQLKIKNEKLKIGRNSFSFLYVGQIEEHKGVNFLVAAFSKILLENPAAELIVVGGGAKLEEIKRLAEGKAAIKILGRKNENEVRELMLAADCLIVPSLCYENSPTVIYEAIASRLPVIGAKIGGITELLEAAGGILFEPGNADDLAKKIAEIIKDKEELESIRAKQESWVPPDYIDELLKLAKA
ncbi:MAG TPA: glycosyltransferase family 4 protein [Candidatus Nanoarchaeia archaeon]|nr:glycosyltransferase family 4 protein [Candidatus Nanoarchaeia archaeon]